MNPIIKKGFRTFQTNFPYFLDAKFALMRRYRKARGVPFDEDFNALGLFPDIADALYLDVGANRGQSTDAILLKRNNCRIHLFEPNPVLCERLGRQFGSNRRIEINAFGLGEEPAQQALYVPFYKRWMFDGLASFDEERARGWLRERMFFYKETHLTVQKLICRIRPLDELDLQPFFMKLDVQGYEVHAIKGGIETIRKWTPVLLVESAPPDEILSLLGEHGYDYYAFRKGRFLRGTVGKRNTFFMTQARASLVARYLEPQRSLGVGGYAGASVRAHG